MMDRRRRYTERKEGLIKKKGKGKRERKWGRGNYEERERKLLCVK